MTTTTSSQIPQNRLRRQSQLKTRGMVEKIPKRKGDSIVAESAEQSNFIKLLGYGGDFLDYATLDAEQVAATIPQPPQKRRGPRGGVAIPFPNRLMTMLEDSENQQLDHVVSWRPHGRCFVIHDPTVFLQDVISRYFKQSKLTSFHRQLNLYGFQRLSKGPDRGGYFHPLFLRGRPDLVKFIHRISIKGDQARCCAIMPDEPNLYVYPPCLPAKNIYKTTGRMNSQDLTEDFTASSDGYIQGANGKSTEKHNVAIAATELASIPSSSAKFGEDVASSPTATTAEQEYQGKTTQDTNRGATECKPLLMHEEGDRFEPLDFTPLWVRGDARAVPRNSYQTTISPPLLMDETHQDPLSTPPHYSRDVPPFVTPLSTRPQADLQVGVFAGRLFQAVEDEVADSFDLSS